MSGGSLRVLIVAPAAQQKHLEDELWFAESVQVIGWAATGTEVRALLDAPNHPPDAILVSVDATGDPDAAGEDGQDGIAIAEALVREHLVLLLHEQALTAEQLPRAIRSGAAALVEMDATKIVDAVRLWSRTARKQTGRLALPGGRGTGPLGGGRGTGPLGGGRGTGPLGGRDADDVGALTRPLRPLAGEPPATSAPTTALVPLTDGATTAVTGPTATPGRGARGAVEQARGTTPDGEHDGGTDARRDRDRDSRTDERSALAIAPTADPWAEADMIIDGSQHLSTYVEHHDGKIVTFFSPKGGSGCTTLALNTALGISRSERHAQKVLLVDFHLEGGEIDLLIDADVEEGRGRAGLAALLGDPTDATLGEAIHLHPSGLHLLLTTPEMAVLDEAILTNLGGRIKELFHLLRSRYDLVIVDVPPCLNVWTLSYLLGVPQRLVLVMQPELPAIRATNAFLKTLQHIPDYEFDPASISIALNMSDRQVERVIGIDKIEQNLGVAIAARISDDYTAVVEAINTQKPIADVGGRLADELAHLAEVVVTGATREALPAKPAKSEKGGMLSRLFRR